MMKLHREAWLAGLALFVLGLAGPIQAANPEAPSPGGMESLPPGTQGERYITERLAQIHAELKLAPAQEADWKIFSDRVAKVHAEKKEAHPDFDAIGKLSAPDRLQKLIDAGKARQAMLEDVLTATKTFYATLSAEQRKVFDDLTPLGERAPRWRRGGPGHRGAPK